MATLNHPNIVRYISSWNNDSDIFVVMEYVSGGNLLQLFSCFNKIPQQALARYLMDILNGLEYLHSNSIIHRDIKPSNILITPTGVCKLADFGLSMSVDNQTPLGATLCYVAPEVWEGQKTTTSVDIWALGIMVRYLLNLTKSNEALDDNHSLTKFIDDCLCIDPVLRPSSTDLLRHPFLISQNDNLKINDHQLIVNDC
eukprot:NODE_2158_length_1668_cov_29.746278_g1846_i0.p1 GENE.NODE_2158_length_1668_cov_29.746278_g1846_i0~~NODE_2158_length_1668_cov_29.746278_g1846_i0.p1  ORF type:complete len:199 (+),score=26.85 NODE_2158_length_1668_cov_29.746278_g1846_i0:781-1377(+)